MHPTIGVLSSLSVLTTEHGRQTAMTQAALSIEQNATTRQ
jgi:hypothetical protein